MLDSGRTFKIKLRLRGIVFEILFTSAIMCIERVLHGSNMVLYLQNNKRHEFDQGHSGKLF